MKTKKKSGRMRILVLLCAMFALSVAMGSRAKNTDAALEWVELKQAEAELLQPGHAGTFTEWYHYRTDSFTTGMRLCLYTLDIPSGRWNLLREGEIRLDETEGLLGLTFDQADKLWAAVYTQDNVLLAQMNAEEKALPAVEDSYVWWKKTSVDMKGDDEVTLAVQSLVETGAQPIDPREAGNVQQLKDWEGLRAAYALTVQYVGE